MSASIPSGWLGIQMMAHGHFPVTGPHKLVSVYFFSVNFSPFAPPRFSSSVISPPSSLPPPGVLPHQLAGALSPHGCHQGSCHRALQRVRKNLCGDHSHFITKGSGCRHGCIVDYTRYWLHPMHTSFLLEVLPCWSMLLCHNASAISSHLISISSQVNCRCSGHPCV